jgi:hypothetical protein
MFFYWERGRSTCFVLWQWQPRKKVWKTSRISRHMIVHRALISYFSTHTDPPLKSLMSYFSAHSFKLTPYFSQIFSSTLSSNVHQDLAFSLFLGNLPTKKLPEFLTAYFQHDLLSKSELLKLIAEKPNALTICCDATLPREAKCHQNF